MFICSTHLNPNLAKHHTRVGEGLTEAKSFLYSPCLHAQTVRARATKYDRKTQDGQVAQNLTKGAKRQGLLLEICTLMSSF